MPSTLRLLPCIMVCLAGWLMSQPVHAFDFRAPVELRCHAGQTRLVHCDYRLLRGDSETHSTLYWQSEAVTAVQRQSWPWPGGHTAVLFVIDNSDPERKASIQLGKQHIAQLLEATRPHHLAGLASLSRELQLHAPVGSSRAALLQGLKAIEASGTTTELYRNTLVAIDILAATGAERRLLFLFSGGQADDHAYFHQDVVDRAQHNRVVINSLGYPRSARLAVTLQILRRMSEETAGLYQESPGQTLSERDLQEALAAIDSGGRFAIPLDALRWPDDDGPGVLQLRVQTTHGVLDARTQVARPVNAGSTPMAAGEAPEAPVQAPPAPAITESDTAASQPPATPAVQDRVPSALYGIVPGMLLLVVLLCVLVVALHRARQRQRLAQHPAPSAKSTPPSFSFAYLLRRDQPGTRHPITRAIWHVGRGRDNDLRIDDSTVSRRHAVLRLQENGEFAITDLESSNGTFVNEQRVTQHDLRENDIVAMGRTMFYYTHRSDEDEQDYLTDAMRPV